jgi:hypothetical protein
MEVPQAGRGQNNREVGDLVRLQVSLEGATPQTNDLVRGRGSFDQALKSLEMFQQVGLNRSIVIFVCVTKTEVATVLSGDLWCDLCESMDLSQISSH